MFSGDHVPKLEIWIQIRIGIGEAARWVKELAPVVTRDSIDEAGDAGGPPAPVNVEHVLPGPQPFRFEDGLQEVRCADDEDIAFLDDGFQVHSDDQLTGQMVEFLEQVFATFLAARIHDDLASREDRSDGRDVRPSATARRTDDPEDGVLLREELRVDHADHGRAGVRDPASVNNVAHDPRIGVHHHDDPCRGIQSPFNVVRVDTDEFGSSEALGREVGRHGVHE